MTTEQLKPCAHCDGLPLQAADTGLDYDHDTIVCDDCGATAPTDEAWNRRTPVEQSAQTEQPSLSVERDLLQLALGEVTHYHGCPQDAIPPTGECACFGGQLASRIRTYLSAQRQDSDKERITALEAAIRSVNAVAIERGDKYGACDQIDNAGQPYQSAWFASLLVANGAPK